MVAPEVKHLSRSELDESQQSQQQALSKKLRRQEILSLQGHDVGKFKKSYVEKMNSGIGKGDPTVTAVRALLTVRFASSLG